jgi:ATP-binding cassette subfamily B protein
MSEIDATGRTGVWAGLKQINRQMTPQRRRQFYLIVGLMFAGATAELATVGAVMPFLALLAEIPGATPHWGLPALQLPGFVGDPLLIAAAVFIVLATIAGLTRLQLVRSSRSFVFGLGHEINAEIQRRVLLQPYTFHIHRNTSTLLSALNKTEVLMLQLLLPLMRGVVSAVIAAFVVGFLLFVAPVATLFVAVTFIGTYLLVSAFSRQRLQMNSAMLATAYDERLKIVQESLGGIRDVIIDNSHAVYLREFDRIDSRLAAARATTESVILAPRYLIEIVGMALIAAVAVVIGRRDGGIGAALPILGALALGGQRLLPLVQEVYAGWSSITGQRSILNAVVALLSLPVRDRPVESVAALRLRRAIELQGVSFSYPTRRRPALDGVYLTIPAGTMVALTGPTGSGKSTLVDVLMGLLPPDEGIVLIDDVPLTQDTQQQWHRTVAHVPQSIFLADSAIAQNIALSLPDLPADRSRIVDAAKKAQLHDFIISLPAGYDTFVGERGIRLSGGQRQRLGIARAIYKNAPIIVLDEATSALDDETERAVMATLDELRLEGRTVIIVAHRFSTIHHCNLVARLDHGRVVESGPLSAASSANPSNR